MTSALARYLMAAAVGLHLPPEPRRELEERCLAGDGHLTLLGRFEVLTLLANSPRLGDRVRQAAREELNAWADSHCRDHGPLLFQPTHRCKGHVVPMPVCPPCMEPVCLRAEDLRQLAGWPVRVLLRAAVAETLLLVQGMKKRAAVLLGVSRRTVYSYRDQFDKGEEGEAER